MSAKHAWPWAIAGILALTVAANVALFVAAGAPGATQVEPDYYQRALRWDRVQAERVLSAALGWRAATAFRATPLGTMSLEVTLLDRQDRAVQGAEVRVHARHNLEPGAGEEWRLREVASGRYGVEVQLRHRGRWELELVAVRGAERFTAILHADAPAEVPR